MIGVIGRRVRVSRNQIQIVKPAKFARGSEVGQISAIDGVIGTKVAVGLPLWVSPSKLTLPVMVCGLGQSMSLKVGMPGQAAGLRSDTVVRQNRARSRSSCWIAMIGAQGHGNLTATPPLEKAIDSDKPSSRDSF